MYRHTVSPRTVLFSAVYLFYALMILAILGVGLHYFFEYAMFPALNWFNARHLVWKFLIVVLGGYGLFWMLLKLVARMSALIGGYVFGHLPQNSFTMTSAYVLSLANSAGWAIWLWRSPERYGFWVVVELILLTVFVWMLSAVVLPPKVQAEIFDQNSKDI